MSEMVERVARALCRLRCERNRRQEWIDEAAMQRAIDYAWDNWTDEARAAIEAMREPTIMMENAGATHAANVGLGSFARGYRAAIDEAIRGTNRDTAREAESPSP